MSKVQGLKLIPTFTEVIHRKCGGRLAIAAAENSNFWDIVCCRCASRWRAKGFKLPLSQDWEVAKGCSVVRPLCQRCFGTKEVTEDIDGMGMETFPCPQCTRKRGKR